MTVKRERVARQVRARIERGDYADGQPLIQTRLAEEYGVHREVVWYALAGLQRLLSLAERLDLMEKSSTRCAGTCCRPRGGTHPQASPIPGTSSDKTSRGRSPYRQLRAAVHVIKRMIQAQAAARAYPREFRLHGTAITGSRNSPEGDENAVEG
jgi:hypothetical protein